MILTTEDHESREDNGLDHGHLPGHDRGDDRDDHHHGHAHTHGIVIPSILTTERGIGR